ncbi:Acg family FMN-binding oxidoreductase [Herbidospora daliensis]|uniref:Acg family FMN-binding oxidoreductase n=1 Tax=Herbidospora daliensis TaxID=295585 RepID=UPI000785F772|nr:hypothetical protein [Herbidospora daliensis]
MTSQTIPLRAVVQEAVWAPSVHNTQPWSFVIEGEEIRLRADTDRRLGVSDPDGREMFISCGAAVFTLRTALRALGREAIVHVLPDPDRPVLVAIVKAGDPIEPDEHTLLLHAEITRRRTHRAGFSGLPVAGPLLDALVRHAGEEGARLALVDGSAERVLAALTTAAQLVAGQDRTHNLELKRWGRPPGSGYRDGVPADAYPNAPRRTHPHFEQRDYSAGNSWGNADEQPSAATTGQVAVITTPNDTAADWITAGQALQHVLLHASAYGVGAAFHTQALEFAPLRSFIAEHLCAGQRPQLMIRLGYPLTETAGVRRRIEDVLDED